MPDRDRLRFRITPFDRQLRRAVRELVDSLGVERVISIGIGTYARADPGAGEWLTAHLARLDDTEDRTRAFAAVGRVALCAALVELVRQYEAGELPEAQAEVVRRWVDDRS